MYLRVITALFLLFLTVSAALPAWAAEPLRVSIFPFSPPFSFFAVEDGEKKLQGYTVDECRAIGEELGRDINFVPTSSIKRQTELLKDGKLSVIAHDSESYALRHGLAFLPVGSSLNHHLYRHESYAPPQGTDLLTWLDLSQVVVVKGAPYIAGLYIPENRIEAPSALEALSLLDQGVADVYIAPAERVADYLVENHGLDSVRKVGDIIGEVPLGILLPMEEMDLIREVGAAIKKLERTGTLARIRDKWFSRETGFDLSHYYRHIAVITLCLGVLFAAFAFWNITLKRRVERVARDLRQTEQRYRDLIESSPDMIFLVTEDGSVLHANERARTNLNLPVDRPAGNMVGLVESEAGEEMQSFLNKVFYDGCDKFEFRMDTGAGQAMEVEFAGRVIQAPVEGGPLACLFARNVTERNRMEEELVQAERLAIIGKMAAGVAHEINNPLGIIQFNAEDLLYAEEMSDEARDGLTAISRNASRAADTITHLLDLASPKPLAGKRVDLADVVAESLFLLGPKLKGTCVDQDMADGPLALNGDTRALQQVVVNLLLNALHNMGKGGVIRVEGCAVGRTVRLIVADTGKGVERENLSRIFEPFFTSRDSGFGLGLFISRRIVERHDGIVFAESTLGRGTCFMLEFPALDGKEKN